MLAEIGQCSLFFSFLEMKYQSGQNLVDEVHSTSCLCPMRILSGALSKFLVSMCILVRLFYTT